MKSYEDENNGYRFSTLTHELAYNVITLCKQQGLTLGTAESCTGGLIAAALTEISGSSAVVWGGIVAYANDVKCGALNVSPAMLERAGAVSEVVARAMAEGALSALGVDLAVSVTGVAGPEGGTVEKPVGLVHMAVAYRADGQVHTQHHEWRFGSHSRESIRAATVQEALKMVHNTVANRNNVA